MGKHPDLCLSWALGGGGASNVTEETVSHDLRQRAGFRKLFIDFQVKALSIWVCFRFYRSHAFGQLFSQPSGACFALGVGLQRISPSENWKFEPRGFLDLQSYVKEMGVEAQSLQKIYALLFGKKISKSQRLTNWEADVLTDRQKAYAATDAWACVRIYKYMEEMKHGRGFRVVEVNV